MKKERYIEFGKGHLITNKKKIITFVSQLLSNENEDRLFIFKFDFKADRYYKAIRNLKEQKLKEVDK